MGESKMGKYNLEELYNQVKEAVATLDFEQIWEEFKPLKFALYDDQKCYFNGEYIEKTADFCANTAIEFQGETIAIWNVVEELKPSILASKIVHEMFHAFQMVQGWDCWARELEALYKYQYNAENLSIKLNENKLLLELLKEFNESKYHELMRLRKYRSEKFPYEFSYETKVEAIEGSATYVEWQALKQLDMDSADSFVEKMEKVMTQPEYFFPIRISSYNTGALLIYAMHCAEEYSFTAKERPVIVSLLKNIPSLQNMDDKIMIDAEVDKALKVFTEESKSIVEAALSRNEVALKGPLELDGLNIYDARCYNGYLTSRIGLRYKENGESKLFIGDSVIRMKDESTIDTVYKWVS